GAWWAASGFRERHRWAAGRHVGIVANGNGLWRADFDSCLVSGRLRRSQWYPGIAAAHVQAGGRASARCVARAVSRGQSKSDLETDDPGRQLRMPGLQPSDRSLIKRRGALVKRFDCLKVLASLVDEHMLAVTSLSTNAPFWFNVRPQG